MAICKHCGKDDLDWFNEGTKEQPVWKLTTREGEPHRCIKNGEAARLGGVFMMLRAMSPKELANTIAYASKELCGRVERALTEADPPLKAVKPGAQGPEPMDENLPF